MKKQFNAITLVLFVMILFLSTTLKTETVSNNELEAQTMQCISADSNLLYAGVYSMMYSSNTSIANIEREHTLYAGIAYEMVTDYRNDKSAQANISKIDSDIVGSTYTEAVNGDVTAIEQSEDAIVEEEPEEIFTECNETMYSTCLLNARIGPSVDTEVLYTYSINESVVVIGKSDSTDWYKVTCNGQDAFVNSTYISTETIKEQYYGQCKLTGYSACVACCGKSDGITASGTVATANRTVAINGIPFGTKVRIGNTIYTVEDRGGGLGNGHHVDIFFNTYNEALQFGLQYSDVYIMLE